MMRMRTAIPLSQRIGARHCRALVIASLAYFAAMTQGCALVIDRTYRIGPDPDHVIVAPATRTDVERRLGRPIETERLADGGFRAVYEYTARVGGGWLVNDFGRVEIERWTLASFGLSELIFMPVAYFKKDRLTYQKEYIYDLDEKVAESYPERPKP